MASGADNRVVFASSNEGKARELRVLFRTLGLQIVTQTELGITSVEETGETFVENAFLKAQQAARLSGLPAVADDSGLCVDALDGRPGVYSARYAGADASDEENIDRLLAELADTPDEQRTAAFHCAAVFTTDDGKNDLVAEGRWPGLILRARDGDAGFGYDPVFFDPASGKSAARMSTEEKNAVSHRGRAFRRLEDLLRAHKSRL